MGYISKKVAAYGQFVLVICENHRKSNKIMHCDEKKLFDWQF